MPYGITDVNIGSSVWCQAITKTNVDLLSIDRLRLRSNFAEDHKIKKISQENAFEKVVCII